MIANFHCDGRNIYLSCNEGSVNSTKVDDLIVSWRCRDGWL